MNKIITILAFILLILALGWGVYQMNEGKKKDTTITTRENTINTLETALEKERTSKELAITRTEELTQANTQLEGEKKELNTQIKRLEKEISDLKLRINTQRKTIEGIRAEIQKKEAKVAELEQQIATLNSAKKADIAKIKDLENQQAALSNEMTQLQDFYGLKAYPTALFLDRDGVLAVEPPNDYQLDALEKLELMPGLLRYLPAIIEKSDFTLVMVTNQDGLGTDSFPENTFWPAHNKILNALEKEGVIFDEILIDRSFEHENKDTRKPGTGMLTKYMNGDYDLAGSYVVGDRLSDMKLAENIGAKGILLNQSIAEDGNYIRCESWKDIYEYFILEERAVKHKRKTKETDIEILLNLDGKGEGEFNTGLGFFDHMLEQIARHGAMDLRVHVNGDLEIDEHHTIEDTGLALGEAFRKALSNKLGMERYGYMLPMDDCLAQVAIDFGGRPWIVWDADFIREKVGDMPTEMFFHFFKSFSDAAQCNLNIKAEGKNEHHKIEAIFKAFARAIRKAVKRDPEYLVLPSTKGTL